MSVTKGYLGAEQSTSNNQLYTLQSAKLKKCPLRSDRQRHNGSLRFYSIDYARTLRIKIWDKECTLLIDKRLRFCPDTYSSITWTFDRHEN